jgi:hypothetical protein
LLSSFQISGRQINVTSVLRFAKAGARFVLLKLFDIVSFLSSLLHPYFKGTIHLQHARLMGNDMGKVSTLCQPVAFRFGGLAALFFPCLMWMNDRSDRQEIRYGFCSTRIRKPGLTFMRIQARHQIY